VISSSRAGLLAEKASRRSFLMATTFERAGPGQLPATDSAMTRYRRAVDYIAAGQIYLKANPLLEEPLKAEHIKDRLLGHWGTAPGINLVYAHLNRLIRATGASVLLVTGPGHGAAANMANLWLEGTLTEFYPAIMRDRAGLQRMMTEFSWPYGFPSHLSPAMPGVIHEGGELGYALSTSFGAALDNPELIVVCIVGDGEAETAPTAGAWNGNKFASPATDGAVLPILHLNGFKISNPTISASMSEQELESLYSGHGYAVRFVSRLDRIDEELDGALDWAHGEIRAIQGRARAGTPDERPRWPMIVLVTPKGLGAPREIDGERIEGTFRAHQVPVKDPKTNPAHLAVLEKWLRSYRPQELFDAEGRPAADLLELCPPRERRIAMNPAAFGGDRRVPLALAPIERHAVAVDSNARGTPLVSHMKALTAYLCDVVRDNEKARNFRIVCPDELESNRLGGVLDVTRRQYTWPLPEGTEKTGHDGRVLEVLSEHLCQGWLQGYLLTGRHGLFPCYEAFVPIVDGMMNQYAKFLEASTGVPWRKPISSLNYLLTSEAWRQDHNGFSHQGPGFINNLLTKKGHTYRIYLPPDGNCLLSTMDHCLRSTNYINLVIAGKQPMHQWLTLPEAAEHCRVGASTWSWASTNGGEDPQIVLAACGDNMTLEVLAAAQILREVVPEWRIRVVNVTDLIALGIPQKYPHGLPEDRFQRIFPLSVPVVFNFHGYTAAIKQLCWERPGNERFDVNGYREEGSTTTPFDMHVRNRTSRYHVVIQAAQKIARRHPALAARAEEVVREHERKIREHRPYIRANGIDPPEITNWTWTG
jgi:xylulose-5-phosphate/fructose-6-phosphate phosphoketolase